MALNHKFKKLDWDIETFPKYQMLTTEQHQESPSKIQNNFSFKSPYSDETFATLEELRQHYQEQQANAAEEDEVEQVSPQSFDEEVTDHLL